MALIGVATGASVQFDEAGFQAKCEQWFGANCERLDPERHDPPGLIPYTTIDHDAPLRAAQAHQRGLWAAGLAGLCGSNKGVESATLVCLKDAGSQQEYFRLMACDGGVRNHTIFTSARHNRVLEAFQITFKTLKISYQPQTGRGSMGGMTQYELNVPGT